MMKFRKKYLGVSVVAAVLLSACSDDEGSSLGSVSLPGEENYIWFSFPISGGESQTRAEGDNNADAESAVHNVTAYLTDDEGKVVSIGVAQPSDIVKSQSGNYNYEVKVRMLTDNLTVNGTYSLYVAANFPAAAVNQISTAWNAHTPINQMILGYTGDVLDIPSNGIPMSTADEDCIRNITLSHFDYPKDNPYMAGGETNRSVLKLTRLMAKFEYADRSEIGNNTYPLEMVDGGLKVQFVKVAPVVIPAQQYVFTHKDNSGIVTSCETTFKNNTFVNNVTSSTGLQSVLAGDFSYWKELTNSPAYSETGSDNNMTLFYLPEYFGDYSTLTTTTSPALLFEAKLLPGEATPAALAAYLNGTNADGTHPTLYYFDDGLHQSMPGIEAPSGILSRNWYIIQWNQSVGGYTVRYFRNIRHGGTGNEVQAPAEDDLTVSPMEYGVMRNQVYPIAVTGVKMLPHPFDTDGQPEFKENEINIMVQSPKKWSYHRGAFEIEVAE